MPLAPHLFVVLIAALSTFNPSWAAPNQDEQGCMIRNVRYTAQLSASKLDGSPHAPVLISVQLDPATLPMGYFAASNVRILSAPAVPEITPGFPDTKIVCPKPGEYILEIETSLITKSSCAGVEACSMNRHVVTLHIL